MSRHDLARKPALGVSSANVEHYSTKLLRSVGSNALREGTHVVKIDQGTLNDEEQSGICPLACQHMSSAHENVRP